MDRYEEVKAFVLENQKPSPSFIQRNLGMGWEEALRYLDQMEAEGWIGPQNFVGKRVMRVAA